MRPGGVAAAAAAEEETRALLPDDRLDAELLLDALLLDLRGDAVSATLRLEAAACWLRKLRRASSDALAAVRCISASSSEFVRVTLILLLRPRLP